MNNYRTIMSPFNGQVRSPNDSAALQPDDDALQAALAENRLLFEISARLNAAANYDDVMRAAVAVGSATVGSLALFDLDEQGRPEWANALATWVSEPGLGSALAVGVRVPVTHLHDAQIWLQRPDEPFLVGDVATDPRLAPLARSLDLQAGTYARVVMPLRHGGRWLGFITLGWPEKRVFGEAEQRLYKLFATQAALVLSNLWLAAEAQTDITERQRAEHELARRAAELEDTSAFLDSVIENLPTMLFVKEADSLRFIRWNKAGEELIGYSREALLGKNDYDFFPKEEADFFILKDREVLGGGTLVDIPEEPIQTAHQGVRWLHTRKIPVYDASGQPKYLLGISEDITERKQAEAVLREREEDLQTLLEYSPEAIGVVNIRTGLFDNVNGAAERLYGLPRAELVKVGPGQMSPEFQPDGRPSMEKALEKIGEALAGGHPVFEWTHRNAAGQDIPCEVRLVGIAAPRQHLVRFSVTDITDRKRGEAALAKRAAELATVVRVSTAATTILNPDQLLQEVVDLTKTSFGLYHAHIYLLDEAGDTLVLASGAGEVGRQMVADGRRIPLNREQSLVARAARTRQGTIVNDVRADLGFLPHPLLPETRSELAVPIVVGDVLLGVFDVQSSMVDRFTDEDVRIQTALAAQVAVALQNARVYARARQQVERETLVNTISQKIQGATTVESALQIAARELGRALQAPRTTVQLGASGPSENRHAE